MTSSAGLQALGGLIQQSLFTVLIQVQTNSGVICNATQNLTVTVTPGAVINCKLETGQTIVSSCNLDQIFNVQQNIDWKGFLSQAVDSLQSDPQFQKLSNQFSQVGSANLSTYLKSVIETHFDISIINTCLASASQSQTLNITLSGVITQCPDPIKLSQFAQMYVLSNCISNNIINILSGDPTLANAFSQAAPAGQSSSPSPSTSSSSTTAMSTSTRNILIASGVILFVVLLVAGLLYAFKGRNRK